MTSIGLWFSYIIPEWRRQDGSTDRQYEHIIYWGVVVDVDKITAQVGDGGIEGGNTALKIIDDCIAKGVRQETPPSTPAKPEA